MILRHLRIKGSATFSALELFFLKLRGSGGLCVAFLLLREEKIPIILHLSDHSQTVSYPFSWTELWILILIFPVLNSYLRNLWSELIELKCVHIVWIRVRWFLQSSVFLLVSNLHFASTYRSLQSRWLIMMKWVHLWCALSDYHLRPLLCYKFC